jgi:hypothetical protein
MHRMQYYLSSKLVGFHKYSTTICPCELIKWALTNNINAKGIQINLDYCKNSLKFQ